MRFPLNIPSLKNINWWQAAFCVICLLINAVIITKAQPRRRMQFDAVFSIAFSPDGKTLAIGRGSLEYKKREGQIEICDAETGKIRNVITGFDGPVWSVQFSADGKTIISSSSGLSINKIQDIPRKGDLFSEIKWWDVETGELKRKKILPNDDRHAVTIAYSPSADLLASAEYYYELNGQLSTDIRLLDSKTGEIVRKIKGGLRNNNWYPDYYRNFDMRIINYSLQGMNQGYQAPIFSPDGKLMMLKTVANEIKTWDIQTGKEVYTIKGFKSGISALTFSPDSKTIAAAQTIFKPKRKGNVVAFSLNSEIRLYDTSTGKIKDTLNGHEAISSLTFYPGSNVLLVGNSIFERNGWIAALRLIDLNTKKAVVFRTDSRFFIRNLAFSDTGKLLGIRNSSQTVNVVDTETWKLKSSFEKDETDTGRKNSTSQLILSVAHVLSAAFSPDGNTLAGGNEKSEIKLWDPRTGEIKKILLGHEGAVSSVAISSDGETIVSGSLDETARIWNLKTGNQKAVISPDIGEINTVAISPNNQMAAIGGENVIALWDLKENKLQKTLTGHQANINGIAFSSDGKTLVSASDDKTIKLWDVETGESKKTLTGDGKLRAIGFAPNGQTLVSGSETGLVNVWDVQTGSIKQTLKKHEAPVNAVAFSKDGNLIISGSDDRKAIIWDAATGKSKESLKNHDLTVTSVAFSPNGDIIASGSGNESVILWDVKSGDLNRILK